MKKLLLLSLLLLLNACATSRNYTKVSDTFVQIQPSHDTCYIHDLQLDSVYFYESEQLRPGLKTTEKGLSPSGSFTPDTVVITRIKEHYRIQHDTIRSVHRDTIPIIRTQEVVREVPKPVPRYIRYPAYAMYALIAALIVLLILKVAL